jgi:hypothetical protein
MDLGIHDGLAIQYFHTVCAYIGPSILLISRQIFWSLVQIIHQVICLRVLSHLERFSTFSFFSVRFSSDSPEEVGPSCHLVSVSGTFGMIRKR